MPLSWVEIDLEALRHNYSQATSRLGPNTSVIGVVKSDAYGHGMLAVAQELVACGAAFLAVSKYWEAEELRLHGIEVPILILLGCEAEQLEPALRWQLRPAVFRMDHARLISETAARLGTDARVHVKVDTGMGRLGIPMNLIAAFLDELLSLPGIVLEGVLSHFAVADERDKSFSELQVKRFMEVLKMIAAKGWDLPYAHMSNSAGILDLPHAHFQLVRPGIMLYGSPPSQDLHRPAHLLPVMTFKSRILQLKDVAPGQPVGYGRTYVTHKAARIATVPVGYDDGYFRMLSNRGQVLARGMRAPVVGRVSMNMITVDVTHIRDVREDDEVVLLGPQGNERITAEEVAELCGTISYEIYCSIGRHRHKFYRNRSPSCLAEGSTGVI